MLARIRNTMEEREGGFTLIELLVVVIIIGILAAIAIPTFLNQRQKAWEKSALSDLRNNAAVMETFFDSRGTYVGANAATGGVTLKESENVDVTIADVSATDYCLQATHSSLPGRTFSMKQSVGKPGEAPCTTTSPSSSPTQT